MNCPICNHQMEERYKYLAPTGIFFRCIQFSQQHDTVFINEKEWTVRYNSIILFTINSLFYLKFSTNSQSINIPNIPFNESFKCIQKYLKLQSFT